MNENIESKNLYVAGLVDPSKGLNYDQLLTIRVELNRAKRYYGSLIGDDPSPFFGERVLEIEEILSVLESLSLDLIAD